MDPGQLGDVGHDLGQPEVLRCVDPGHAHGLQLGAVRVRDDATDHHGRVDPGRRAARRASRAPARGGSRTGSRGPTTSTSSSRAAAAISAGRQADALVDDLHARRRGPRPRSARRRWSGRRGRACRRGAGSAGRRRLGDRRDLRPHRVASRRPAARATAPTPVGPRYSPNTSRSAPAHSPTVPPASASSIVAGTRFSVVAATARSRAERGVDRGVVARRAPLLDRLRPARARPSGSIVTMPPRCAIVGERRRLGLGERVHADDLQLARLDAAHALGVRSARAGPSSRRSSRTSRRRRAPARARPRRPRTARRPCASTTFEPSKRSSYSSRSDSYASTCWMRSDHCWSHGVGRPSASFQHGSCTARARASFDSVTPSISSTMRCTLFSGCSSVRPSEFTCTP